MYTNTDEAKKRRWRLIRGLPSAAGGTFHHTSRLVPEALLSSHFAIVLIPPSSRLNSDLQESKISCGADWSFFQCLKGSGEVTHQVVPVDRFTSRQALPKMNAPTATFERILVEQRRPHAVPKLRSAVLYDADVQRRTSVPSPT
jgi:hypothetical protein